MEYVPRRIAPSYSVVLARVRAIPEGFVRSYGDISPGAPRFSGTVLSHSDDDLPWWRVVHADGSLAKGDRQRALLEDEGVPFRGTRVDMGVARLPADVDLA
jgi:methylated-DNA-protein-cysteine methyltransferase related protein